jgi:DNA-binding NarL/FixJ family response regulator
MKYIINSCLTGELGGTLGGRVVDAFDNKLASTLTRRQRDVLNLIVQGRSNKEIARSLKLGEGTVKVHVAALFSKLGVNRRAAVAIAGSRFITEAAKGGDPDSRPRVEAVRIALLSGLTNPSRFSGLGYTSRLLPRIRLGR